MIPANLTHYIETEIIPRYEKFDKAHNLSHVQAVIEESLSLAKQYDVNESMAYTIAAYHDTGLCHDRATHHLISGEILKQDVTLRQWFNEIEIETMKWNSQKNTWENDLRICYAYQGKSITTTYYKWNSKQKAYVLVPDMTVTMDNPSL